MMRARTAAVIAGCLAAWMGTAAQAEVFVYPKKGQNQQQFEQDQFQCHKWATNESGVDPSQPVQAAAPPPPPPGSVARPAARGAAAGAVGGAIAGDAGKGAAIGAAVGATAGVVRRNRYNREVAAQNQQAQAQQTSNIDRYERAYGACMEGRGYQVK